MLNMKVAVKTIILFIKSFFKYFVFVKVRTSIALVRTSVFLKPLVRGQVYIFEISPPLLAFVRASDYDLCVLLIC